MSEELMVGVHVRGGKDIDGLWEMNVHMDLDRDRKVDWMYTLAGKMSVNWSTQQDMEMYVIANFVTLDMDDKYRHSEG